MSLPLNIKYFRNNNASCSIFRDEILLQTTKMLLTFIIYHWNLAAILKICKLGFNSNLNNDSVITKWVFCT